MRDLGNYLRSADCFIENMLGKSLVLLSEIVVLIVVYAILASVIVTHKFSECEILDGGSFLLTALK